MRSRFVTARHRIWWNAVRASRRRAYSGASRSRFHAKGCVPGDSTLPVSGRFGWLRRYWLTPVRTDAPRAAATSEPVPLLCEDCAPCPSCRKRPPPDGPTRTTTPRPTAGRRRCRPPRAPHRSRPRLNTRRRPSTHRSSTDSRNTVSHTRSRSTVRRRSAGSRTPSRIGAPHSRATRVRPNTARSPATRPRSRRRVMRRSPGMGRDKSTRR